MKVLRAVGAELVSLVVDDVLAFATCVVALVVTYLLAHTWRVGRAVDGFVLFALVWLGLALSLRRESRRRRSGVS